MGYLPACFVLGILLAACWRMAYLRDWWAVLGFGIPIAIVLGMLLATVVSKVLMRLGYSTVVGDRAFKAGGMTLSIIAIASLAGFANLRSHADAEAKANFYQRPTQLSDAGNPAAIYEEIGGATSEREQVAALTAQERAIANVARKHWSECSAMGDHPVRRMDENLVWDLEREHGYELDPKKAPTSFLPHKPLTVFLVGNWRVENVGFYTSFAGAFKRWVDVCVVQFADLSAEGRPVAYHEVEGREPPATIERTITNSSGAEYGDISEPLSRWLNHLPVD
jgi:hypothetical protein